ncbi:MAG TPA: FtsQ-type POTRA domain-containing protein [Ktedonobacterales bacterium]|nr:FtsQ-type POTRA domain-containing protein [Ktedonobacterales bacterium]
MFKRSNKAKTQQPTPGSVSSPESERSLVDVTFRQRPPDKTSRSRGGRRAPQRPTNPARATPVEEQPTPSTMIGLGWARAGAQKHAQMRAGPKRRFSRSRRERWLRRAVVIVPLLLVVVFGLHALFTTTYFEVQQITIEGTRNGQLIAAIERLHLTGVNIFLADTSADAALVKTLPPIADASVTRNLPNTLLVHVVERQPVLIWQVGATLYSVDAGGAIIGQVQQADGLPVMSDEHSLDQHGHPFAPGGKIDPKIIQMARHLLEQVPTASGITSFTLRDTLLYGIVLFSAEGWQARFGGPDNLQHKIDELAAIVQLVRQQGQQLALIDLRFGNYPYYRLKSAGAEP